MMGKKGNLHCGEFMACLSWPHRDCTRKCEGACGSVPPSWDQKNGRNVPRLCMTWKPTSDTKNRKQAHSLVIFQKNNYEN